MPKREPYRRYIAAVCVATGILVCVLNGCSEQKPDALVASARDYLAKGDYNAAVIQLRNASETSPNDGEVRFLLAGALLQVQNAEGAVKEYQRALELQVATERVYPPLARALLEANSPDKVIAELAGKSVSDSLAQADLQTSVGQAYLTTGRKKEARAAFARALAVSPGYPGARLGEARLLAGEGKMTEAFEIVDEVLVSTPADPEGLFLKGELLREQGRADEAIAAFEQVVKARPRTVAARRELAGLLIQKKQFEQAAVHVDALKKIAPKDPPVLYLQAQLALQRGQQAEARSLVQQALKAGPDYLPGLVLAGRIELDSGSYAFAEQFLRKALTIRPQETTARTLLVTLYLRAGQPARALEALRPLLDKSEADPVTQALAGEVYLANKDPKTAAKFLERANGLDPQNTNIRTRLAQVRYATGDVDRALKDLQAISKSDPEQFQADVTLITSLMQRGEFDKALEAARTLEKKQPGNPLTFQLYGAVYLAKNDIASARESFEKSLTLQATYLPALQALARLDVQNGNPGAARKRYETTLAKYPEDAALLLSNAALLRAIGADPREEGALLERALQAAPGVAEPRVALAEHYLRVGDRKKALEVAQQANVVIPNDARIVEALGIAQQANGNVDQAIQTFGQLARLAPNSASVQARLAGAYAAAKDYPRALQILRGAIALDPQRVDLHSDIAAVLVQAGRHDDALAEARALQKQRPKEAAGFIIEADVLAAQQKWRDAATMYRVALGRSADSLTADKAVASLKKLEGSGETSALTGRWLKENPKDLVSHMYLADRAMGQKDYKSAMPHLRILVELQPSNAVLLNNLAWAGAATGDSQAVAHAERAHRLAPTNPFIMDTYGWLLIESGDLKRGVEVLQQAAGLAPGSQEVRLHLAKALLKSGQKDGARKELEAIMRTPGTSTFRDEAASILKTL